MGIVNNFLLMKDCVEQSKINTFYLLGLGVFVLRIAIPVVLLIFVAVDLIKFITTRSDLETGGKGADTTMRNIVSGIIKKTVLALAIFVLPTLISIILNITNTESDETSIEGTCVLRATSHACRSKVDFSYVSDPEVCFGGTSSEE